jgi:membrane associated rhomboid family serine protease
LLSNSVIFLVLSWLVLTRGGRDYLSVWVAVLVMNVPIALLWPARSHGLSGVIYGLLGYLLVIGWLEKKILPIVLSLVAFWLYGSALMALIPGVSPAGVSWVGHAGGFAAGLLAAWAQEKENPDAV